MWNEWLERWPMEMYHYLQDAQPIPLNGLWNKVQTITSIPEDLWYSDFTPQLIEAPVNSLRFWQGQRLTDQQLADLRHKVNISVWNVIEDHVAYVVLAPEESSIKFFHHAQRQVVRMIYGLDMKMEGGSSPKTAEVRKLSYYLHATLSRPLVSSVQITRGTGKEMWRYEMTDALYIFCEHSLGSAITVPFEVQLGWYQHLMHPAFNKDYLEVSYYQSNIATFNSWTYQVHQRQVQDAIGAYNGNVIVAPGDGGGVVAHSTDRAVISGDLVYSDTKVVKETFIQTMVRGKRKDPHALLILSYVTSLMSPIELHAANNWSGPVCWIDSVPTPPFAGFVESARGVWVRGFAKSVMLKSEGEPVKLRPPFRYSENLARLPEISYVIENEATQYWSHMRPFSKPVLYYPGVVAPLVAYDLKQWLANFYSTGQYSYLAVAGRIINSVVDVRLELDNKLTHRVIYRLRQDHWMVKALEQTYHSARRDEYFYFIENSNEDSMKILTIDGSTVVIRMLNRGKLKKLVKLISVQDSHVTLMTPLGIYKLNVRYQLERDMIEDYLMEYATEWKEKFLNLSPVVDDTVLRWGIDRGSIKDEYYFNRVKFGHSLEPNPWYLPFGWIGTNSFPEIADVNRWHELEI
jgi:hypothetical protein